MHTALQIKSNNDNKLKLVIEDDLNSIQSNYTLLYQHINAIRKNKESIRSAHYKNVSGINKSNKKIRPQKRMGKSRQGTAKEIHMRGGAVKFGFSGDKYKDMHLRYRRQLKINKKEKNLSQKIVLANKINNNLLQIIDLSNQTKTKTAYNIITQINHQRSTFVYSSDTTYLQSIKNIKNLYLFNISSINIYNMIARTNIIFDLNAIKIILNKLNIKYKITE